MWRNGRQRALQGTRLSLQDGRFRVTHVPVEFTRVWLGDTPVQDDLKKQLLGQPG
jgi:hypothetical protein